MNSDHVSASSEQSESGLPPLPEQIAHVHSNLYDFCMERSPGTVRDWPLNLYTADQMRSYALQAVAAERERCAKICESLKLDYGEYAAAIRNQGKP